MRGHTAQRTGPVLLALLTLLLGCAPSPAVDSASPREAAVLNSERIAQRFGSYGVEVLSQTDALRISSLYSEEGGQRICRTYAVVQFLEPVDPRLARAHRLIMAGGSLGATLIAEGWQVTKSRHLLAEIPSTPRVAELMAHPAAGQLATDIYLLSAVRAGVVIDYAVIAEIHHPDYLRLTDLASLPGAAAKSRPVDERVRGMLEIAREAMR